MKVEKFKIVSFDEDKKEEYQISVPFGSDLKACKVLHDGIYIWAEIPSMHSDSNIIYRFVIINTGHEIPVGAKLMDIVDSVVELESGDQALVIYPIYQLTN